MTVQCIFDDVSERDMDMLIAEEMVSSAGFRKLFLDKIGISDADILSVELSKTDPALGESDITVTLSAGGKRIGLLIEDKVDAIAMPEQAARYTLRGERGVSDSLYGEFYVFIAAPQKYLSENHEAAKYPNRVSYEEMLAYFQDADGRRNEFQTQKISQAIKKQKTGYQVREDAAVTEFWRRYAEFQKAEFPDVWFLYSDGIKGANATWPRFNTVVKGLFFYHKSEFGCVDLTFEGCAGRIGEVERILQSTVNNYLKQGFTVQRTGKAAAIRLSVPVLDFHLPFDAQSEKIRECFTAIRRMNDLVKAFDPADVSALLTG